MIKKDTVVGLHYQMFDANDQLIDETQQPIVYLHGGYDGIFPLVEEALHGKTVGDEVDIVLQPDDAFGEQDPELVRIEPADAFPSEVKPGMMFEAEPSAGGHENPLQSQSGKHPRGHQGRNRTRPRPRPARSSSLASASV